MIVAAISSLVSIIALFVQGHYLLSFVLLILNLLVGMYLLYGKLIHSIRIEKPDFPKDVGSLLLSAVITSCLYALIYKFGSRSLEMQNSEVMLVVVYCLLLSIVFVTIKIQQEEKR
jgi:hypothetical protein